MTAQQIRDIIIDETGPNMTPEEFAAFTAQRFAGVDPGTIELGLDLASKELRRQAKVEADAASELARYQQRRRLRVV
ncbi:hypothetical protein [Bradyrhizobium lablabi]|uniref:hypothetical protein n=1 Tax=Bradyrhizobium lablabi TaxID=722472 RepID=UPI001BA9049C|nr:hypothetical protein [Bradyrhizobium lablabi]MBR0698108.1 hypothetical protein [Bradyrhizobium lablabi]